MDRARVVLPTPGGPTSSRPRSIAAHGSPIFFLRKGSREDLREATGDTKLPALKLPDGRVITHSRAILAWIREQS